MDPVRIRDDREYPDLTCPYCKDKIVWDERNRACSTCSAWHHPDCWEETGRCSSCLYDDSLFDAPVTTVESRDPAPRESVAQIDLDVRVSEPSALLFSDFEAFVESEFRRREANLNVASSGLVRPARRLRRMRRRLFALSRLTRLLGSADSSAGTLARLKALDFPTVAWPLFITWLILCGLWIVWLLKL